jgi:NADH-quinone oxidoreductase subunit B
MESIPAPHQELIGARAGKPIGANDPFFADLNSKLADKGFLVAAADNLIAWARTGSLMWMQFGLACCAIEMMQVSMPRYDIERFGFAPRASPHRT